MGGRYVTGLRFGSLTVIERVYTPGVREPYWDCECDCGRVTRVRAGNLRSGNTTSCGNHPHIAWSEESAGGATFEEIAAALKISKTLARALCERALRKLRGHHARALREEL